MPRDEDESPHLARIEERLEQMIKRFDRYEQATEHDLQAMERTLREAFSGRLETIEARYTLVRVIVLSLAATILLAFLNFVVSTWTGAAPMRWPTVSPYHSSQELKERSAP